MTTTEAQVWQGADSTPVPENSWPTAGQFWHELLTMDPDQRLDRLFKIVDAVSVRGRMERALHDAASANVRMAEANSERLHRSIQREEALKAKIAGVEALHRPDTKGWDCECCETAWPCPTAEAMGADHPAATVASE